MDWVFVHALKIGNAAIRSRQIGNVMRRGHDHVALDRFEGGKAQGEAKLAVGEGLHGSIIPIMMRQRIR
jgi:hypothetical protein